MVLKKDGHRKGRINKRVLSMGLAIALVAIAATGITAVIAEGDNNMYNNQLNYGEDGYYEDNNCNPYDDADFPGLDEQNRTGVE
jgi:hypothetical protein